MAAKSEDIEWLDGEVITAPMTSTGHKIIWQCCIGEWPTHQIVTWADYTPTQQVALEAAHHAGVEEVPLTTPDKPEEVWLVRFADMTQTNPATGTTRQIRRIVVVKG